jgi:hypothetical protein
MKKVHRGRKLTEMEQQRNPMNMGCVSFWICPTDTTTRTQNSGPAYIWIVVSHLWRSWPSEIKTEPWQRYQDPEIWTSTAAPVVSHLWRSWPSEIITETWQRYQDPENLDIYNCSETRVERRLIWTERINPGRFNCPSRTMDTNSNLRFSHWLIPDQRAEDRSCRPRA